MSELREHESARVEVLLFSRIVGMCDVEGKGEWDGADR